MKTTPGSVFSLFDILNCSFWLFIPPVFVRLFPTLDTATWWRCAPWGITPQKRSASITGCFEYRPSLSQAWTPRWESTAGPPLRTKALHKISAVSARRDYRINQIQTGPLQFKYSSKCCIRHNFRSSKKVHMLRQCTWFWPWGLIVYIYQTGEVW